jgi:hypothetical protein
VDNDSVGISGKLAISEGFLACYAVTEKIYNHKSNVLSFIAPSVSYKYIPVLVDVNWLS